MDIFQSVADAIGAFASGRLGSTLLGLAAVGTIAMALLQVVKEITPVRRAFNQRWFEQWIDRHSAPVAFKDLVAAKRASSAADAKAQIVELATGGLSRALYDLPVEEMVVQMNLAAQVTLDAPGTYKALLLVLACGVPQKDLDIVLASQAAAKDPSKYFDARTRVARRIQRNLDGVRIGCGNRWQWVIQMLSIALTVAAVELAVFYSGQSDPRVFWLAIPIGFVGSYFAPITRDILAGVQKLRK